MSLTPHETWSIIDSSKMQAYMSCPRMYFFEYILGWRREEPNIHLEFGTAVHMAMEHLLINGYGELSIYDAYKKFETQYRLFFPSHMDEINSPKTPGNFFRALPMYCLWWKGDKFDVMHTEVAGPVMIDEGRFLYYKTDSILKGEDGLIFSLEHKTTGRFSSQWLNDWKQKIQVGTYYHVLNSLFGPKQVQGVTINGLMIKNPPQMKKDGVTPYANSVDTSFIRVPIRRTWDSMNEWLFTVNSWYDDIERDTEEVIKVDEDEDVMYPFRKNTESCSKYFGCPYTDYCNAWTNPVRKAGNPPQGFKTEFWDPRSEQDGKEVIEVKLKGD